MPTSERTVLHVLPHPGGGGETYVDFLDSMPGYRFSRLYLATSPALSVHLARGVMCALRAGRTHDLVHVHGEIAGGLCLPLLATRPSVVTMHGLHLLRRKRGLGRRAAALILRTVCRAADRTICVSVAEHQHLTTAIGPSAARRALVVRNGVRMPPRPSRTERARVREELGLAESEPVGIWVGSLDERKDPLTAIRASMQASVTLLVVGDGPLRSEAEQVAHENVHLLGERHDLRQLLGAADFFVVTSRREGLSFALLEAMSYGLPAAVTDLSENIEAIGDSGIAVPVAAESALATAFRRLASSAGERTALGQRARQRVAEYFDSEEMVGRTQAVYDEVFVKSTFA